MASGHHVPRTMGPIHAAGKLIVTYFAEAQDSKVKHRSIDLTASRLPSLHKPHLFPPQPCTLLST